MNDKTTALIEKLADQFGTTVGHLWGVMLYQAKVSAIIDVVMFLLSAAALTVSLRGLQLLYAKYHTPDKDNPYRSKDIDGGDLILVIGLIVVVVMATPGAIISIIDFHTATLNPEYWALQQVLSAIKGGG